MAGNGQFALIKRGLLTVNNSYNLKGDIFIKMIRLLPLTSQNCSLQIKRF